MTRRPDYTATFPFGDDEYEVEGNVDVYKEEREMGYVREPAHCVPNVEAIYRLDPNGGPRVEVMYSPALLARAEEALEQEAADRADPWADPRIP
jgi:hypothetical protein